MSILKPLLLGLVLLGTAQAQHHGGHAHAASPAPAQTKSQATLPLTVTSPVVRAVPPSIKDTIATLTLTNRGSKAVKLVGVSAAVSGHGMLMKTVKTGKMMGMKATPFLVVPAGGKLVLEPAGDHVMLMGLKRPLKVGEQILLTLKGADGRTLRVSATVKKPG